MTHQEIFNKVAGGVASTTFLTGLGVTGTVATAYFAGRGGFKAAQIIEQEEKLRRANSLKGEALKTTSDPVETPQTNLSTKEKIQLVWPLFVPAASLGVTTILAIVLSNHESSKKIAAATAAAGISERAFMEYKNKVAQKLTKPKETAIRDDIAQDRINNNPPSRTQQIIIAGTGDVLCYDMQTDRYFSSSMEKLRQAENEVNREIIVHNYASLSRFYDEVGLKPTPWADSVGWNGDNMCNLTFSTVMSPDDRPCIAIDFEIHPFLGYNNLYG